MPIYSLQNNFHFKKQTNKKNLAILFVDYGACEGFIIHSFIYSFIECWHKLQLQLLWLIIKSLDYFLWVDILLKLPVPEQILNQNTFYQKTISCVCIYDPIQALVTFWIVLFYDLGLCKI